MLRICAHLEWASLPECGARTLTWIEGFTKHHPRLLYPESAKWLLWDSRRASLRKEQNRGMKGVSGARTASSHVVNHRPLGRASFRVTQLAAMRLSSSIIFYLRLLFGCKLKRAPHNSRGLFGICYRPSASCREFQPPKSHHERDMAWVSRPVVCC
jgi:hypothetical protein